MDIRMKWNGLSFARKVMFIARIIISVVVVVLSSVGLAGVVDVSVTNSIAIPLVGIVMLMLGIEEFRRSKILALIFFGSAALIVGISFMILLKF